MKPPNTPPPGCELLSFIVSLLFENSKNYFGVFIGNDTKPVRIVLRAYGKMIPLLRTLPMHHSQKEIATRESHSDFEYCLVPTFDFQQAILKEGHELEVVEPLDLRERIREELAKAMEHYQ